MITATVTINVGLFIFFLLIAFIAGLMIAFFASASAVNASYKEHQQERFQLHMEIRPTTASESTIIE